MAALLFQGTGSISSTHITRWLTTTHDSRSRSDTFFWPPQVLHTCGAQANTQLFSFLFLSQYLFHLAQDDPEPRQPSTSGSPDSITQMLDYRHVQLCPISCCTRDWPQDSVYASRPLFNSTVTLFSSQTVWPTTIVIIHVFATQIYSPVYKHGANTCMKQETNRKISRGGNDL